ncbi:MAG TPA: menaquinone biosynthesis protein [Lacibacter sp.]|nr:menaquinone biosynthesis protein [Lacibacter sp.]
MEKIKVGAVSYLNTKPMLYGMQNEQFLQTHELVLDYPAHIGEALKQGIVDVGLVPAALLPSFEQSFIVSDYCIAADFDVASVCLFSEVPLEKIETIYLDYQSRSSAALLKILMREFWGIQPVLVETKDESFRTKINGSVAALVIGDRAFEQRRLSTYVYDLAAEWRGFTGLPFVFAVWVSLKPMSREWMQEFNAANAAGMDYLEEIAEVQKYSAFNLRTYFQHHIAYQLTPERLKGLERFLELLKVY